MRKERTEMMLYSNPDVTISYASVYHEDRNGTILFNQYVSKYHNYGNVYVKQC